MAEGIFFVAILRDRGATHREAMEAVRPSEDMPWFQFAGENAQTAALDSLRLAQNMEINDYSTDEIWRETGWYKGKDGKWRFEISDDDAVVDLSKTATDAGTTLGNILSHDKLYSAYPELRGLSVIVSSEMKGGRAGAHYLKGVYDKDLGIKIGKRIEINSDIIHRKDVDLKSIIMHEVQHAIQDIEGFASGGSVSTFFDKENMDVFQKLFQEEDNKKFNQAVLDALYGEVSTDAANKISDADDKVVAAAEKFALAEGDGIEEAQVYDDALEELDNALKEVGKSSDWFAELKTKAREKAGIDIMGRSKRAKNYDPFELYKQLYGEVEARNTQARMDLTEEERRVKTPESTQDVANADAIVIFDDGTAMAYEPKGISQQAKQKAKEVKNALQKIADGAEEATVKDLRDDLEQYGGTNDVTFIYGDEKKGLFHIADKHGGIKTLLKVLDTVVDGKITDFTEKNKTIHLIKDGYEAILSLDEYGKKKTWLLTGFDTKISPDAEREFNATLKATQTKPTFSRQDLGAGLNKFNISPSAQNVNRYNYQGNQSQTGRGGVARGAYSNNIIYLFEHADASTVIHELGHYFLDDLQKYGKSEKSKEQLQAIYNYLGAKDGVITTEMHEYFADSFEVYLKEGKAPNSLLRGVFIKFKNWLRRIFSEVKRLEGVKLVATHFLFVKFTARPFTIKRIGSI